MYKKIISVDTTLKTRKGGEKEEEKKKEKKKEKRKEKKKETENLSNIGMSVTHRRRVTCCPKRF